ncbi:MAG: hypothetical protein NTW26_06570, partial [bacterium]|nr:hypothetical protein [bacterium]
ALWRIPPDQLDTLELRVIPLHPQAVARLPASMRPTPPLTYRGGEGKLGHPSLEGFNRFAPTEGKPDGRSA